MGEYEQAVIAWIKENCMKGEIDTELTASTSLLAADILDSLQFVSLVEYLCQQYGVDIDEDDMSPDNFESVSTIAELIRTLKAA
jgi:acyl carrier protein